MKKLNWLYLCIIKLIFLKTSNKLMIKYKRVYEAENVKGYRVLIDRLWPRGISNEKANLDEWLKEIAPSEELRKWFNHEPSRWEDFKEKYIEELKGKQELMDRLVDVAEKGDLVLLYAAKDEEHNNAVVLKEVLELQLKH
jgi:uncharacterized protein YeaO (DUF488 family)